MQAPPHDQPIPLRRRAANRILAGVAGGLADRFVVSPLGLRLGFGLCGIVLAWGAIREYTGQYYYDGRPLRFPLSILGGLGVLLYLGLWFAVPREDRPRSAAQRLTRHFPNAPSWLGVALFLLGGGLLGTELRLWSSNAVWALLLIGLGVLLFRRDAARATPGPRETLGAPGVETPAEVVPTTMVRRAPRERSPLGWMTFGTMLLVVGGAAILANLGAVDLELQRYPALGLLVLAAGLLVGTFVGRARWLILPALLLVPGLLASSLVHVPLEGGFGNEWVQPRDPSEVAAVYRNVIGGLYVDLSALRGEDATIRFEATTGYGDLQVVVPYDARVVAEGVTGAGEVWIGRTIRSGAGATLERVWEPKLGGGPTVIVRLEAGIGRVMVYRESLTRRERRLLRRAAEER